MANPRYWVNVAMENIMKVNFNLGAISFTASKKSVEHTMSVDQHDGAKRITTSPTPPQDVVFGMGEGSYSFECEIGELAELYSAVSPIIGDLTKQFTALARELQALKNADAADERQFELAKANSK